MKGLRFGAQLWPQASDWPAFVQAATTAETAGWDSVWTWDHLTAIVGPWQQPVFEGWVAMAAVAASTSRVSVGLMVTANTFRTPGQTAKLVTTLDHVSAGRAVLGIGGAYVEREHRAFGIDFGRSPGERLDRLEEAVGIIRDLLDGKTVSIDGPTYRLEDGLVAPRPVQEHLPILIGGGGVRKTLRTVARHADAWNTNGTLDEVLERDRILREHCAVEGRDPDSIERTVSFPALIRDDPAEAEVAYRAVCRHNGVEEIPGFRPLLGSPQALADRLRPFVANGFSTIVVRFPAPYDPETLGRIGEVRAALAGDPGA
jgi:alkanesulfonate monooxygenase SsuD/methylene tetrahydromethanopterin reductase-like flavin-dependent oxidoreductase (luciferase family)